MPARTSDTELFDRLFDRHAQAVHAYFLGRLDDRETARDLLQETFLRVWRRMWEVRRLGDDRRLAWIFTVARNLAVDDHRTRATRRATVTALAREPRPSSPDGAAERAEGRDRLVRLRAAINRLPEEQRTILSMATIGELTSRQIGEALDQPAGTVRYKLGQARKQLAAALDLEE